MLDYPIQMLYDLADAGSYQAASKVVSHVDLYNLHSTGRSTANRFSQGVLCRRMYLPLNKCIPIIACTEDCIDITTVQSIISAPHILSRQSLLIDHSSVENLKIVFAGILIYEY